MPIFNKLFHCVLILFLFTSSLLASPKPLVEPIFDVPNQAKFVDLIGKGAKSGRSDKGETIFKPASLEALLTHKGQFIIGSETGNLSLNEPINALLFHIKTVQSDVVVEMTAYRGEHGLGSHLFAMDDKARSGSIVSSDGVIGLRSREPFDRIALRVAHAPDGESKVALDVAWVEVATKSEQRGGTGNDFATLCQIPLGISHNIAFGASLVPGPQQPIAQGTVYATNLALKWCLTYIEAPDSRTKRVPNGVCEARFEQPHMASKYGNALGVSLGYNSNWGELGSPTVYHHNTEVDVVMLYNQPTPEISPSLDLEYWANTGSLEATDRIYEDCRADGSVRFSQLDGSGPRYECPYAEDRELIFPIGDRVIRWRVNARMSALDLFAPLIPGIPSGAKLQPWKGLLINTIREAILIANDAAFFSGWRIDNYRDAFQFVRVYDEVPPTIDPQPFNASRIEATLIGNNIHVQIEADEPGGVSANNYLRILESMYQVSDACGRDTTFFPSFPEENLRIFWPVSTSEQNQTFEIIWTAKDPGPNLLNERNETITTMTVEVVDIRPPAIVPPPDIIEVGTGQVSELGQPLVFDFVDLDPIITNDANLPLNTGLHQVTWTATDSSGNTDTAIQIVNIKNNNNDPVPIAQTGQNRQDAVTFEPQIIRLEGNDPDNDPLRFYVEQYPENGFFVAPLYPYFVEDFRLQAAPGEAEEENIEEACQNQPNADDDFDLEFPMMAEKFAVDDNGRSYMVDRGLVNCLAGNPSNIYDLEQRIVRFGASGELEVSESTNDDNFSDLIVDEFNNRVISTTTNSPNGLGQSTVTVYDLDLNEIDSYNLRNLKERGPNGSIENCTINLPHNTCEIPNAISAIVDANGLVYVMQKNGRIYAIEESNDPTNPILVVGVVSDDVTNDANTDVDASSLALDADGNLYASRNNRIYKYAASFIDDIGYAQIGSFVGWLGRCDTDLAPGDEAVCDTFNKRSVGYSCTDAVCGVDPIITQDERDFCNYNFTNNGNFGCRPGQFYVAQGIDIDPRGTLYVADVGNLRIQRFTTDGFFAGEAESECDGSCFVLGDFGTPEDVSANADRFYIFDPDTDLLHISLLTPFTDQGADWAELVYQSNNDFACQNSANCIDQFAFSVSDGVRDIQSGQPVRSTTADVEVEVMRNFRPPVATPGIAIMLEEDTPTDIFLDGSDLDTLDSLNFVVSTAPRFGTVQVVDNLATYIPDPDFYTTAEITDSFAFSVGDGVYVSASEEVILTVAEINDAPMVIPPDDATVGVGFVYRLNAEFYDPDPNEQHRLIINWGDGSIENETEIDGGGPEVGQSGTGVGLITGDHIYSAPGTYTVELCLADRVTGDDGSETLTSESLIGCNDFEINAIDGLDIEMSSQATSERALPNQLINVQFSALNKPPSAGPATIATGVVLTVDLPEGLTPGSIFVSGTGCSFVDLQVTCNIGNLNPSFSSGAEITAQVDANASPGTVLTFLANATQDQVDVNPNNEIAQVFNIVPPADIYVDAIEDGLLDKSDVNPGDGICESEDGVCTLRAAIEEANALPGQRVIALGSGVFTQEQGTLFTVAEDLILLGNGAGKTTIDGSDGSTVLSTTSESVTLRIEDLTIARGGIQAWPGDLVIRRSRITGGMSDGFVGGAIIANNLIDIRDTLIDGNRAVSGGAVWAQASSNGVFENVTITGNQGGGLYLGGGNYELNHVTITGNFGDTGGASGISGGALTLANNAIVSITGSVLGGNYQPPGLLSFPLNCAIGGSAALTSNGNNIFGDLTGCNMTTLGSDIEIADNSIKLGPLKFLGDSIPYLEPRPDSPAIDAMSGPSCPATDARGLIRPQDGDGNGIAICDIGAVEYLPPQIQASQANIDFGDIPVNTISMPATITITNTGNQNITIDTITLIGPDVDAFELPTFNNQCIGTTLTIGQQCQFEIEFSPAQEGVFQAAAKISVDSQSPDVIIELAGSSGLIFKDGFEGD
ncbi:choice-of-anchor D domain-containing protein [Marinicella litoralis]|nr:choice-of-anchor D domain-containing protein [Marinicella litoralis]